MSRCHVSEPFKILNKEKRISIVVGCIIMVYALPVITFATYYNYQYFREKGFIKWLFMGEVVSTAKGFIWPYYVFFSKDIGFSNDILTAVVTNNINEVEKCINAGANIGKTNSVGLTLLMVASKMGHSDIVSLLLKNNADPNRVTKEKVSALIFAASEGHKEIVIRLIRAGADVNVKSIYGTTALKMAQIKQREDIENMLLKNGAKQEKQG